MPLLPNAIVKDVQLPRLHHLKIAKLIANTKKLNDASDNSDQIRVEYSNLWENPLLVELSIVFDNHLGIKRLFNVLAAFSFTLLQSPALSQTLELLTSCDKQVAHSATKKKQTSLTQLARKKAVFKKLKSAIWIYYNEALVELRLAIDAGEVRLVKAISKILGAVSFFANTSFQETAFFDDCAIAVIREHFKTKQNNFNNMDGALLTSYMYQFKSNWFPNYNPNVLLEFTKMLLSLQPLMSNAKRAIRILFTWLQEFITSFISKIESELQSPTSFLINSKNILQYSAMIRKLWIHCPSKCHLPETIFQEVRMFDLDNVVQAMYHVLLNLLSAIFPTLQALPPGNIKKINDRAYFHMDKGYSIKLSKTKMVMRNAFEYCWKVSTFFYYRQRILCLLTLSYRNLQNKLLSHPSVTHLNQNEVILTEFLKLPIRSHNYPHMPFMMKQTFTFVDEYKVSALEFEHFYQKNLHHYDLFRRKPSGSNSKSPKTVHDSKLIVPWMLNEHLESSGSITYSKDSSSFHIHMTPSSVLEIEKRLFPESKRSQVSAAIDNNTLNQACFLDSVLNHLKVDKWERILHKEYEEYLYFDLVKHLTATSTSSFEDERKTNLETQKAENELGSNGANLPFKVSALPEDFDPWFLLDNNHVFQETFYNGNEVYNILDELSQFRSKYANLYEASNS